ncbi:50S ribosomal protein L16 [Patescibacteria group bacterium]|jgi:large subunit ribosomal protein L16|nr:50S ribosomal protein L16 [Patescibacteria group bacterium]
MLFPKKVKHRKTQRGKTRGRATRGTTLTFGSYGLKSLDTAWLSSKQIEAARRAITHYLQRGGKVWIRVFPDKPQTRKGTEVPMGGGKGNVEFYVAPVEPGRVLFELEGVNEKIAQEALRKAAFKLPIKTTFIKKD